METPSPPSPAALPARPLGKSGIDVPILGFGGAPLGDLYAKLDESVAIETILTAIRHGVSFLDTSPLYGFGLSEHRIGAALRHLPEQEVILSTKVGRVADPLHAPESRGIFAGGLPHSMSVDYSYDGAMRSIEQSLLRLGRDHIDIVLVHDLDRWTHGDELEQHYQAAGSGCVPALRDLKEQKVIRAFGVGVNESDSALRFCKDFEPDVVLLAGRYSLLEQPALLDLLPHAARHEIGVILGGVFNSGILATGNIPEARYNYGEPSEEIRNRVSSIEAVCREFSIPLRRAALQFVFGHPSVSSVVLGAVHAREIVENCAEFRTAIPTAFWTRLRDENLISADAPIPQDSSHDSH